MRGQSLHNSFLRPMSAISLFMRLQERNTELREEVHFLEQRRLEEWGPPAGQQRSSSKPSAQRVGCAAASQPKSGSATPRTSSAAAAGPSLHPAPAANGGRSPELAGQAASDARLGSGPQHEQQRLGGRQLPTSLLLLRLLCAMLQAEI